LCGKAEDLGPFEVVGRVPIHAFRFPSVHRQEAEWNKQ
jgi:hypothetical protein